MQSKLTKELDPLFHPTSVADVGASSKDTLGRFNFTDYFLRTKFPGKIYPVNPKYQEVMGLPCYPSLGDIPGEVDLAYISVPAAATVKLFQDCPPAKVKFAVIHTSGYREIGKEKLEAELLREARKKGTRLIGPNCMGIYSQEARIGFWRQHHIMDFKGAVGFITQSGGHAVELLWGGADSYIFFNKVVSLGNQIDLSINDFLEYMGADPAIGVVGVYVEDIRDGRRFIDLLRQITLEKPVVVWKGGVTSRGKAAAITHTGSLAGNERIFAAALKQAGGILVGSHIEFRRVIRLLQPGHLLAGRHLAIISPGGGNTVSVCDQFAPRTFLRIPRLTPETEQKLREILPEENVDTANPVDSGFTGLGRLNELLHTIGRDDNIDTILLLLGPDLMGEIEDEEMRPVIARILVEEFANISRNFTKPLIILLRHLRENHEDYDRYRRILIKNFYECGVPWIDGDFKDMAAVIEKIAAYRIYRDEKTGGKS